MALFQQLKVYLVPRTVEESRAEKVRKILTENGARLSSYLTDSVSILIADHPDSSEVGEARDIYDIPVVAMSRHDANILWSIIVSLGGECERVLTSRTTHLISFLISGNKYRIASVNDSIRIVIPQWVVDCAEAGELLSVEQYHPSNFVQENSADENDMKAEQEIQNLAATLKMEAQQRNQTNQYHMSPYSAPYGPPTPVCETVGPTNPMVSLDTVRFLEFIENKHAVLQHHVAMHQQQQHAGMKVSSPAPGVSPACGFNPSVDRCYQLSPEMGANSPYQQMGPRISPQQRFWYSNNVQPPFPVQHQTQMHGSPQQMQMIRPQQMPVSRRQSDTPLMSPSGNGSPLGSPNPTFISHSQQQYSASPMQAHHQQQNSFGGGYQHEMQLVGAPQRQVYMPQQNQLHQNHGQLIQQQQPRFSDSTPPNYSSAAEYAGNAAVQLQQAKKMSLQQQQESLKQQQMQYQQQQMQHQQQLSASPRVQFQHHHFPATPIDASLHRQQFVPTTRINQGSFPNSNQIQMQAHCQLRPGFQRVSYPGYALPLQTSTPATISLPSGQRPTVPSYPQGEMGLHQKEPRLVPPSLQQPYQVMQVAGSQIPNERFQSRNFQQPYSPRMGATSLKESRSVRPLTQALPPIPPELCLVGCVFLIVDYERTLDQKEVSDWRIVINLHGGDVEIMYSTKCTHVVCESLRHPVVQQALRDNKRCVTAQWLNDVIMNKKLLPPWKAIHFPSFFGDNKPCKGKIFAVSGFPVKERSCLKQMILAIGAHYTAYFSRHNHLLVAKTYCGPKVMKAAEWKIPVVNLQWLTEVFFGQTTALQNINNAKYHQFVPKELSLQPNFDPFRIDTATAMPMLMNAWRNPVLLDMEICRNASKKRFQIENDDGKIFPHKRIKLSPPPADADIQKRCAELAKCGKNVAEVRICFTGLYQAEVNHLEKKVLWLGGKVVQLVSECTHLITADLKRTRKLLEGISLGRYIVSPIWIRQSYKQQQFVDPVDFIVKDEGNEKFFGFNVKLSIWRARQKKLFEKLLFYVTPSVQPFPSVLGDLISTAGGSLIRQCPSSRMMLQLKDIGTQFVVIACDNDLHICQALLDAGVDGASLLKEKVFIVQFAAFSLLIEEQRSLHRIAKLLKVDLDRESVLRKMHEQEQQQEEENNPDDSTVTGLKVTILNWNLISTWQWDTQDPLCGICRNSFDFPCPDCKVQYDQCPIAWGECTHCFHEHCIIQWHSTQADVKDCPMCRQPWVKSADVTETPPRTPESLAAFNLSPSTGIAFVDELSKATILYVDSIRNFVLSFEQRQILMKKCTREHVVHRS
ncbi:putative BRCA1 protein [Trichinella nativa]|uniref:Anaphase-promoting complex subunit 11 n=1 Tax=Trichinella nativa TaxID=6335 RepID=A0A1Y3EHK4_9BILA|nr:putative BRCA1 protein [Trichinella nativa]